MNWLDILLIIIIIACTAVEIGLIIAAIIKRDDYFSNIPLCLWVYSMILAVILPALIFRFVVIDKNSGTTTGTITSVDKDFFGTTSVFIRTSGAVQERYCIEDEKLANKAKKLIGQDVVVEYGTRVGWYSTGKCDQAPIETIELITDSK